MRWIKKLASGWSIPGWVVVLFWLLVFLLDWSDRLDSAKSRIGHLMPILRPFVDFITTPQGQISTLVVGLLLLFVSTWRKIEKTDEEKKESRVDATAVSESSRANLDAAEVANAVLAADMKIYQQLEKQRRDVYLCIVDYHKKNSWDGLKALQVCKADELDSNDELVKLCDELVKYGHIHPLIGIEPHVRREHWLDFLKEARLRGMDLADKSALTQFFIKRHPAFRQLAPQPEGVFADEIRNDVGLKLGQLLDEGRDLQRRLMLDNLASDAEYKFDQWKKRCDELLQTSFRADTLRFFRSPASGIPNPLEDRLGTGVSYGNAALYAKIASCVARLQEIRAKLESGELNVS